MKFELLHSQEIYAGRAFAVRRDLLKTPDNREVKFDIIEHTGSVIIIPVDAEGNIYFVRQYRHAAGLDLLELPAGTLDVGEAPLTCAAREIREETGMASESLIKVGGFYLAPGYSTEYMHVFLATNLSHAPLAADEDEFLQVEKLRFNQALEYCSSGQMPDAKTLAALLLVEKYLSSKDKN